jgi:hypothetical protein
MKFSMLLVVSLFITIGCVIPPLVGIPTQNRVPGSLVTPTITVGIPTQNGVPGSTVTPTITVIADNLSYDGIEIRGKPDFVYQTRQALALLQNKAPDAYRMVKTYMMVINEAERSGMWAYLERPRYDVSDKEAFDSITWYSSIIVHDATHSQLYHDYLLKHLGKEVPAEIWTGINAEKICLSAQLAVLKEIGGTPDEIDWIASSDGTYFDVDHDGDYDWLDYSQRDW